MTEEIWSGDKQLKFQYTNASGETRERAVTVTKITSGNGAYLLSAAEPGVFHTKQFRSDRIIGRLIDLDTGQEGTLQEIFGLPERLPDTLPKPVNTKPKRASKRKARKDRFSGIRVTSPPDVWIQVEDETDYKELLDLYSFDLEDIPAKERVNELLNVCDPADFLIEISDFELYLKEGPHPLCSDLLLDLRDDPDDSTPWLAHADFDQGDPLVTQGAVQLQHISQSIPMAVEALEGMKKAELQALCKSIAEPENGRKKDLISRLIPKLRDLDLHIALPGSKLDNAITTVARAYLLEILQTIKTLHPVQQASVLEEAAGQDLPQEILKHIERFKALAESKLEK